MPPILPTLRQRSGDMNIGTLQDDVVEGAAELRVAVVDEEARPRAAVIFSPHARRSCHRAASRGQSWQQASSVGSRALGSRIHGDAARGASLTVGRRGRMR